MEQTERVKRTAEDFTLTEFMTTFAALNEAGKNATIKHKEVYPAPKKDAEGNLLEGEVEPEFEYHAPGTKPDCDLCKPVIENFNEMMMLQTDVFQLTGINIQSLFAAMKITMATVTMMNNENKIEIKK